MPAVALATQAAATQTTLAVETRDQGGRTTATAAVSVAGEDGLPASGAVAISDHGQQVAGAALNKQGQATVILDFRPATTPDRDLYGQRHAQLVRFVIRQRNGAG